MGILWFSFSASLLLQALIVVKCFQFLQALRVVKLAEGEITFSLDSREMQRWYLCGMMQTDSQFGKHYMTAKANSLEDAR